jgi:DNA-binding response OmpR family regulator
MKILLIDPDPIARESFRRASCAELVREVVSAGDFATAWSILIEAERPFDAVFADPGPANGLGFEWLRRIRTAAWSRPVSVVLCLESDPETTMRAVEIGARHFVFKPCAPQAIAAKLRQLGQARSNFQFEPAGPRG